MNSQRLDQVLDGLMRRYMDRVPDVARIITGMIDQGLIGSREDIENDHIAFRTMGVPQLGIASLEKIFLSLGYEKKERYTFKEKKLEAYWYSPPSPKYPRIFISQLQVEQLSEPVQKIITKYTDQVASDPVDSLDLSSSVAIDDFLHTPLWSTPLYAEYEALLKESEYAAWAIYNRYYLNHFTISVHNLPAGYNTMEQFCAFVTGLGVTLNDAGGVIKISGDGLLRQASSVAEHVAASFPDRAEPVQIAGSYVEFAERLVLPEYQNLQEGAIDRSHRRDGFEVSNADKIFESTFQAQTKKRLD